MGWNLLEEGTEAASSRTMKEPWPKPVGDSQQNPKVPARRAFHPTLKLEGSRSKENSARVPNPAPGHLGKNSSLTSGSVSTTRSCRPSKLNGSARRVQYRHRRKAAYRLHSYQQRHRPRGILLWTCTSHRRYFCVLIAKKRNLLLAFCSTICKHASLSELAPSPVRSSAVPRSGTAGITVRQ